MAKSYEQHPLAIELLPSEKIDDSEEFNSFCEDVEAKGLIYPIKLFEGKILDGWRRYRACERTGTALKTEEYTGDDAAGYLASCNIHRRKLSSLQRALFGARMHLNHGVTTRNVCKKYGISNTVLSMVVKAINSKNTILIRRHRVRVRVHPWHAPRRARRCRHGPFGIRPQQGPGHHRVPAQDELRLRRRRHHG